LSDDRGSQGTVEIARPPAGPASRKLGRVPWDAYELGEELGRGGLGRVVRAVDRRLERPVAIKELLPERIDHDTRFAREALITARLEHPSIVPVHEAGRWPNGQPFYAMKLISGRPLSELIRGKRSLDERLALVPKVSAVADAIAYAHAQRVIHRDIKPANVIVGGYGEVMVIDWGLAKQLGEPEEPAAEGPAPPPGHTLDGAVLGTPSYMPPEQARGEPVDERADVYAIGALLYHVLAGVTPHEPSDEAEPRPPQEVIAAVKARAPVPLIARVPQVPRDLAGIVDKALARDAGDRYPTARELADDLSRFLTGQLVSARHYSRAALVRRWAYRHRAAVAVAAGSLLVLLAGGAYGLSRVLDAKASAQRQRAVAEERSFEAIEARAQAEARRNALVLSQAHGTIDRDPTAAIAWLKQLPEDASPRDWERARSIAADAQARGIARHVWKRHGGGIWGLALAADGRIATASTDGTVGVLAPDGARSLSGHPSDVNAVAFAPDGAWLASGGDAGSLLVWGDGAPLALDGHQGSVTAVAFLPGGALASTGYDGTVRVWDLATGRARVVGRHAHRVQGLAVLPDGVLVTVADGEPITVWDRGRRAVGPPLGEPRFVAVSPDGRFAATGAPEDGEVWIVDLRSGAIRTIAGHSMVVMSGAFSSDGTRLATGSSDKLIRLTELGSGASRRLAGHAGSVTGLAFSFDGARLVSAAGDGTVRVWELPAPGRGREVLRAGSGAVRAIAFGAPGLASVGDDGVVRLWDLEAGTARELGAGARGVAVEWAGGRLVTAAQDGRVRVDGALLDGGRQPIVAFALGGERAAWVDRAGVLRLRRLDGGGGEDLEARDLEALAFSADGAALAWSDSNLVRRCRADACVATATVVERQPAWVKAIAWLPDGTLASAGGAREVHVGAAVLTGQDATIGVLAAAPDGRALASGAHDGSVWLWDPAAGRGEKLPGHRLAARALAFSPDGGRLATGAADGSVRLWDLAARRGRLFDGHDSAVQAVRFSLDGKRIASAGLGGAIRLWPAQADGGLPDGAAGLRAWLAAATSAALGPEDAVLSPPR
jgi:WD40 repeat protein